MEIAVVVDVPHDGDERFGIDELVERHVVQVELAADGNHHAIETFFDEAPGLHPNAHKITGTICGVRIEEIEHPLMRSIRYMDKLVDELAKGKPMEKVLRK